MIMASVVTIVRPFAIALFCGMLVTYLMLQPIWPRIQPSTFTSLILVEAAAFLVAGLIACATAPRNPFRAALFCLVGVFFGVVADLCIHPTIDGGAERNLFPLEIAFQVIIAVPSLLIATVLWTFGISHFFKRNRDA
ncbi:MAG TPA: hypothetical protein VK642_04415 [Burkholderiales bacterium]|nr:hypothetical protein [Burkholderiales bacterium]